MATSEEVVVLLNGLIEICKDGEKGYHEAADSIKNGYYQVLFREFARQRGQFARILQACVRRLGYDPERKGSIAGTLHRGWMNLKSAVASNDDHAIIAECERGEHIALRHYGNGATFNLPDEIRLLVHHQLEEIQIALDKLATMKDGNYGRL
jgi:uncharacterized protein (TIGR02284 family)